MSMRQVLVALLASIALGMVDARAQTLLEVTLPDLSSLTLCSETTHPVHTTLVERLKANVRQRSAPARWRVGQRFMVTRFNDEANGPFRT
jgi:hypothetical protein